MTETNGQALAVREPHVPALISDDEIERLFRIAKALAMSNFFKDARAAEQAFAKILFGRDLGLSPTQAMTAIHIVEGKPELSANLQASLVRQTPGYDYKVLEHTGDACEIAYYRDGEELGRSRFTMEDAARAGLAGRNVWKAYPRNMLFARAMSNGVAFHCPEVTGGLRVYAEGEISGSETPPSLEATAESAPELPLQAGPPDADVVEVTAEPGATGGGREVTAAPAQATERPATAKQRGLINAKALEKRLGAGALANLLLAIVDQPPREFGDDEQAQKFVHRNLDRLPGRLVDDVLAAIDRADPEDLPS